LHLVGHFNKQYLDAQNSEYQGVRVLSIQFIKQHLY